MRVYFKIINVSVTKREQNSQDLDLYVLGNWDMIKHFKQRLKVTKRALLNGLKYKKMFSCIAV